LSHAEMLAKAREAEEPLTLDGEWAGVGWGGVGWGGVGWGGVGWGGVGCGRGAAGLGRVGGWVEECWLLALGCDNVSRKSLYGTYKHQRAAIIRALVLQGCQMNACGRETITPACQGSIACSAGLCCPCSYWAPLHAPNVSAMMFYYGP
jgi:hypothetical protein